MELERALSHCFFDMYSEPCQELIQYIFWFVSSKALNFNAYFSRQWETARNIPGAGHMNIPCCTHTLFLPCKS